MSQRDPQQQQQQHHATPEQQHSAQQHQQQQLSQQELEEHQRGQLLQQQQQQRDELVHKQQQQLLQQQQQRLSQQRLGQPGQHVESTPLESTPAPLHVPQASAAPTLQLSNSTPLGTIGNSYGLTPAQLYGPPPSAAAAMQHSSSTPVGAFDNIYTPLAPPLQQRQQQQFAATMQHPNNTPLGALNNYTPSAPPLQQQQQQQFATPSALGSQLHQQLAHSPTTPPMQPPHNAPVFVGSGQGLPSTPARPKHLEMDADVIFISPQRVQPHESFQRYATALTDPAKVDSIRRAMHGTGKVPNKDKISSNGSALTRYLNSVKEVVELVDPMLNHASIITIFLAHTSEELPELRDVYDAEKDRRAQLGNITAITFVEMINVWLAKVGAGSGTYQQRFQHFLNLFLGHEDFTSTQAFLSEFQTRRAALHGTITEPVAAVMLLAALPAQIATELRNRCAPEVLESVAGISNALHVYINTRFPDLAKSKPHLFAVTLRAAFGNLGPRATCDAPTPISITSAANTSFNFNNTHAHSTHRASRQSHSGTAGQHSPHAAHAPAQVANTVQFHRTCYNCKQQGHVFRDCKLPPTGGGMRHNQQQGAVQHQSVPTPTKAPFVQRFGAGRGSPLPTESRSTPTPQYQVAARLCDTTQSVNQGSGDTEFDFNVAQADDAQRQHDIDTLHQYSLATGQPFDVTPADPGSYIFINNEFVDASRVSLLLASHAPTLNLNVHAKDT